MARDALDSPILTGSLKLPTSPALWTLTHATPSPSLHSWSNVRASSQSTVAHTNTIPSTAEIQQPPVFEVFPSAPVHALTSDSIVFHMEVSTTAERIAASWHFGDIVYNRFIFGDPFCNNDIEVSELVYIVNSESLSLS